MEPRLINVETPKYKRLLRPQLLLQWSHAQFERGNMNGDAQGGGGLRSLQWSHAQLSVETQDVDEVQAAEFTRRFNGATLN